MAQISLKIDDDIKNSAESTLNEIGLSMSGAITIFLKKVAREKRIPFELTADPFYSKENIAELERRAKLAKEDKNYFKEHDLLDVD